jgi:pyruvate dehydrogenase E1 component beta subunit
MEGLEYLDAPVRRITAKEAPMPFSPVLENFILPQVEDIVKESKALLK